MANPQDGNPSLPHPRRPRRLRRGAVLRDAVTDVVLRPSDLVLPLFVRAGQDVRTPVPSMPDVHQMSPDVAVRTIVDLSAAGVTSFILFSVIDAADKDAHGSAAMDPDNPANVTLKRVRDAGVEAMMIADLCFCEFTDHGHCGALDADARLTVDNDATLDMLGRQAVVLGECGADVVAPSGMMDGQVRAIRAALDQAGHDHTAILSYSIKYASAMYGPFRDAADGAPQFGDRRGYQMDWRRSREWHTELQLDLAEGADMVMVKPAVAYLDVLRQVREATDVPVVAYHVSGEYSMIHAAAANGWIDLEASAVEITTAIKRAGADLIFSYFTPRMLDWL
ncbi:MAG: porphobilinogen synthase [Planctomycetaceae bacterium]|nr:porphobilinogen synthase [Planctomycetaceae bacterium]